MGSPVTGGLPAELRVDSERLYRELDELGRIGAYRDEHAGVDGVCRLALTDADRDARRLVSSWYDQAGLEVQVDAIGNLYGRRAGADDGLAPVMSGSHSDSVPTAGRYDGALGVLAALEVARTLNEHDIRTRRPLVCALFTEEEGCRFGTDMLGSAVATGRIDLDSAWELTDHEGRTVRAELERIGFLGQRGVTPPSPHALVECHIEQGPLLIRGGHDIGVVTGVQGISWFELQITGRSAHAGTTPTGLRRDAGLVAALINVGLREMADSGEFGEMRGTMGVVRPEPGAINVIPGRAQVTVDLRNPDDGQMSRAERAIKDRAAAIAEQHGVELEWRQTARTSAVSFDESVQQVIADAADAQGLRHQRLIAGAGHDAQEWARICKTAMIFVPGEDDGISHNPRELSTARQCADGANILLQTLLRLLNEP